MIKSKYGCFSSEQISSVKSNLRKAIFFLLLYVDPQTSGEYPGINVADAIKGLQYKLDGLNSLLMEPPELVETMALLEAALNEFTSENFNFRSYRKLILDAGCQIMKIKEGD